MSWKSIVLVACLTASVVTGGGCSDRSENQRGALADAAGGAPTDASAAETGQADTGDPGGIGLDAFVQAYAAAICGWALDCGMLTVFGGTPAACLDMVSSQVESDYGGPECDYDPVAARQCLDGLGLGSCDGHVEDPSCTRICG
ncbi:MAG: hypothetical protein VX265_15615 [Myxococcota bacterium]|nr:hypothetical protein [Myxococcota bacterium]